jgi:SpoVK/Ycf46/Vps4 family AAA+-type ATPase
MVQMEGICAGNASEDTVERRVLLIGCTNCPWDIDDAVMRRFQRRIYVPLPDSIARKALWTKILNKDNGNISISSRDVTKLIQMTEGFSCSDISSIANEAAFGPLRDIDSIEQIVGVNKSDVRPIQSKDFIKAIQDSKKSVSNGLLKKYDTWEKAQAARS